MSQLHWLDSQELWFPPSDSALRDPDGLLAVGGDLSPDRLVQAYSRGIFPWYSEGQPLLWWTPDPRMVLMPGSIHLSRSLKKLLRKRAFTITVNQAFEDVVRQCGCIPRPGQDGSWITPEMVNAYRHLNQLHIAHSVEAWQNGKLVGGLYGLALGKVFFGESMFSLISGASKSAFATLCVQLQKWQFELVDCQIQSEYLASFGAHEISRTEFELQLGQWVWQAPAGEICNSTTNTNGLLTLNKQPPRLNWQKSWQMPENGFDGNSLA